MICLRYSKEEAIKSGALSPHLYSGLLSILPFTLFFCWFVYMIYAGMNFQKTVVDQVSKFNVSLMSVFFPVQMLFPFAFAFAFYRTTTGFALDEKNKVLYRIRYKSGYTNLAVAGYAGGRLSDHAVESITGNDNPIGEVAALASLAYFAVAIFKARKFFSDDKNFISCINYGKAEVMENPMILKSNNKRMIVKGYVIDRKGNRKMRKWKIVHICENYNALMKEVA